MLARFDRARPKLFAQFQYVVDNLESSKIVFINQHYCWQRLIDYVYGRMGAVFTGNLWHIVLAQFLA